jgi:3-hydroxy-9,10-secoandrosta-1,3,5(10)-triene-9,17-dione monooxygenase
LIVSLEASPSEALVTRASDLIPVLRARAEDTEKQRRVPDASLDALGEAGVFKMMAPRRYGGDQASFQTQCDVLAAIARGCPSTSWVATIYSAMAWVAAVFPDEAQEEIFASRDPRISGVFSPTGTAVPKHGGFVLSGRWSFNTGCHGCQWTVVVAVVPADDGGAGVPTCMLVRSRELTIIDDWYASGMAGTGSNTVVADSIFVPRHRALSLPAMVGARYPPRHNQAESYFNHPLASVLAVNAGGTPIGIARGGYEHFMARLPNRGIAYTTYTSKAEAPITHLQVGEAALKIESADAHVRAAAALLDHRSGRAMTREERVKARVQIAYATGLAREAVDTLFFASGASSIQSGLPIQRYQRDMQALANHAIMHAPTAIELYGRVLCGLEPNTVLY